MTSSLFVLFRRMIWSNFVRHRNLRRKEYFSFISRMPDCICVSKFEDGKDRVEDGTFVYKPHFVGNSILLCGRRTGKFPYQMLIGPEWYCMVVTYTLIIVPTFFFLYDVGTIWGVAVLVIGAFSGLLTIMWVFLFFVIAVVENHTCFDHGHLPDSFR